MIDWGAIKTNLASGAIIAILASLAGFLLGTSQTAELTRQIEREQDRIDRIERTQEGRRRFVGETATRLEYLCNRDKECAARFDPMNVPE
ncbi:MAG: hypothetical protein ACRCYS_17210 [Beijerinckiaceae bacterium]